MNEIEIYEISDLVQSIGFSLLLNRFVFLGLKLGTGLTTGTEKNSNCGATTGTEKSSNCDANAPKYL